MLSFEPLKVQRKKGYLENGNYTTTNIESQCMGMQVSYRMDTKIQKEGTLWPNTLVFGRNLPRSGQTKRVHYRRGALDE